MNRQLFNGIGKHKRLIYLSLVTVLFILLTSASVLMIPVSNAKSISETNPTLDFVNVDGKIGQAAKYTPSGSGYQYNDGTGVITEEGKYRIDSASYVVWWESDDFTFGYKKYDLGTTQSDELTVTTTVTQRRVSDGYTGVSLDSTASGGLMMRGGLAGESACVFLHCRGGSVMIVYRAKDGTTASAIYTNLEPVYPVGLKLTKKGNAVTGYIKNANSDSWSKLNAIGVKMEGSIYAGLAAHASDPNIPITCDFDGYTAEGTTTLESSGEESSSEVSSVIPYEDPPLNDKTLLRETFTDMSLTNEPEGVDNHIWKEPTSTNIIVLDDGNRVLNKSFQEGYDLIGDTNWTDYSASADIQYTKNYDPALTNISCFLVRMRWNETLGYYGYKISIKNGNTLQFTRYNRAMLTKGELIEEQNIDSIYGDGRFHRIRVDCFDNIITVYWDGVKKIEYVDNGTVYNTRGCVGIGTEYCDVYFDNIAVTKLEDTLGGDYDNYVGGIGIDADGNPDYNQPIPSYLQNWSNNKNWLY